MPEAPRSGQSGRLLVVDYPGRRDEARVADLGLESAGWDVHYLLAAPMGRDLTCREYALRLLNGHRPAHATAILAYCTGGPIAQEIAARAGPDRVPLPLILFDGAPSRPELIARDFRAAAAQVAGAS